MASARRWSQRRGSDSSTEQPAVSDRSAQRTESTTQARLEKRLGSPAYAIHVLNQYHTPQRTQPRWLLLPATASSSRREQPDRPDRRTTARIPGAFNDPEEGSILEENLPTAATQREELGKEELITHALQYLQDVNGDRARRVARFNNRIRIDGQFVDAHGLRQKIHDLPGYAEKILAALIEGTVADQQCRELYALAAAHQDELTILLERDNDNQKQLADQLRSWWPFGPSVPATGSEPRLPKTSSPKRSATCEPNSIRPPRGTRKPLARQSNGARHQRHTLVGPDHPRRRIRRLRQRSGTREDEVRDPKGLSDPELLSDGRRSTSRPGSLRSVRSSAGMQASSRHARTSWDTLSLEPKAEPPSPS